MPTSSQALELMHNFDAEIRCEIIIKVLGVLFVDDTHGTLHKSAQYNLRVLP